MEGWIKLHRKITENPYYFSEPFTRSQAWIDMLIIANHKDSMFYKRGIRVDIKRGQIGYDIDTLSKRWKWSRGKVERFFLQLEMDSQIVRQKNNVTTLISICNYELYQADSKANDKASSKADGQQTVKQTDTDKNNKNNKNENNDKKERAINYPNIDEVISYFIENGFTKELAQRFFNGYSVAGWKDSNSKQVKNWKQKAQNVWFKPENRITQNEPMKRNVKVEVY